MEIRGKVIIPIGIDKDSGNQVFPDDKLYDAFNIKYLAQSDNTTFVLQNERGNLKCTLSTPILGYINGSCQADNSIVIFTTTKVHATDINTIDRIYKITKSGDVYTNILLYQGSLSFCLENPIQAIYVYETTTVQKVYWTDNLNGPRYINVYGNTLITDSKKFEFIPEFNIKSLITISKSNSGGQFTAGTVQYAISYYFKNGSETNIFDISPVVYASHDDRAGKPGETVGCSFTVTVSNIDDSFDYIRIYTIERSSVDVAPSCRRIDLKLGDAVEIDAWGNKTVVFEDNGRIGTITTPDSLLYVGGESILLGTIAARENTFFGGNITINRPSLKDVAPLVNYSDITFSWFNGASLLIENPERGKTIYGYTPLSLNEIATSRRYFKNNEVYRFGFQAQYSTGKWSEVVYLGEDYLCNLPISMISDLDTPEIRFTPILGQFNLPYSVISELKTLGYVAVRPVFVQPTTNDKRIIAQGIVTNTISYGLDMINIEAYSDYILRTDVYFTPGSTGFPVTTNPEKLRPISFSNNHLTPIISTTASVFNHSLGHGSEFKQAELFPKRTNSVVVSLSIENTYIGSSSASFNTLNNRFKELDIYCENIYTESTLDYNTHIRTVALDNPEQLETDMRDGYFVNSNIVDFWSPDIEFNTNTDALITSGIKLNLVGLVPFTSSSISGEIVLSTTQPNMLFATNETYEEHISAFQDYITPEFDYTTSQGRTKVSYAIGIKPDGSHSGSSIDNVNSVILPTWCRKNILTVPGTANYYVGSTSLTKKSTGRFNYSSFNRYFNSEYIKEIDLFTPTVSRHETNESMIYSLKTNSTGMGLVQSGMNKLFTNPNDVTISNLIKYKTAPHWTAALENIELSGTTYRSVLPSLTWPSPYIWYSVFPSMIDGGLMYIQNSIVEDASLNQSTSVFSDGNLPLDGEMFCYLAELTRELGNSQYGGQKLVTGSYEDVNRVIEDDVTLRLAENDIIRLSSVLIPGTTHIVATDSSLQNNIWIPCGDRIFIDNVETAINVVCSIGDTFLQRYDLIKNGPLTQVSDSGEVSIAASDYQTNTSVVSFLVESTINLDGRYDKNRYNTFVQNMTSDNYNKLNPVYSQANNFFTYRGLDYEVFNTDMFKNSITWSNTKILGEAVDSWTGLDLLNIYDCDGALGEVTSFKAIGMYLIGFQRNGMFNILHNMRTAVSTNDGMPIEIANAQGVSGIRYITTTTGASSSIATAVSPKGLYFIDASNKYIGRYNTEGVTNLSELKRIKSWAYNNISSNDFVSFYNSSGYAIYVDQINSQVYFVNKDYCLIYSELIEQFLGFYSYEGMTSLFNIWGEVYTVDKDSALFIQHKGLYNKYFDIWQPSSITFKFNPDPLIDKTFNWIETNFDAFIIQSNSKRLTEDSQLRDVESAEYYRVLESTNDAYLPNTFFNTLEVSTEFQANEVPLVYSMSGNLQKKFRKWRTSVPRERDSINRIRNNWMDAKFTFVPNETDSIRFNIYNTGIFYTIH